MGAAIDQKVGVLYWKEYIMNTSESTPKKAKKSFLKIVGISLAVLIVLLIILILLVPTYISSSGGTNMLIGKINNAVDGKVTVSDLSVGWFSGVKLTDVKFNDNAGSTQFAAKSISAEPKYLSMLTGSIDIGNTVIEQPNVKIDLAKLPKPVEKEVGGQKATKTEKGPTTLPLSRMDFFLNNGLVNVVDSSGKNPSVQLAGINTQFSLRPIGQQTTFKLNLLAANNPISANGTITPGKERGWQMAGTSGDVKIDVDKLDLSSLASVIAIVDPKIVASGIITAKGNIKINDGKFENIQLNANGSDIKVKAPALKGDTFSTSKLTLNVNADSKGDNLVIQSCELQTDWANAAFAGIVPMTFKNIGELLAPSSPAQIKGGVNVNLAAVASQLPNTLGLKSDTKINSGTLKAQLNTETEQAGKIFTARASVDSLKGIVAGKPAAISQPITIDARIAADKAGALRIEQLNANASFANANITGTMDAIKYGLDSDLTKMQSELGQFVDFKGYKFAGMINAQGNVALTEKAMASNGKATITSLAITQPNGITASEQAAQLTYNVKLDKTTNVLNIPTFTAKTSFANIEVANAIIPLNEKPTESTDLTVTAKADLAKAMPWLVAFGGMSKDTQFGGILNSKLNITSKGTEYNIVTKDTKISNLSVVAAGKPPFTQSQIDIVADVFVDAAAKTYRIKEMKIVSPAINIELTKFSQTIEKDTSKLQGTVKADYDLAAVSAIASPFMPAGLSVTGKRKDTITFNSQWPASKPDMMMANMNSNVAFGWQSAEYMGLALGPAEMKLTVKNGKMDLAPFNCTANGGMLNFAATADFRKKPTMLQIPSSMQILKDVQINDKIAAALLKNVNPLFAKASNTSGLAQFECKTLAIAIAGGTPYDNKIEATASIQDLKLNSPVLSGLIKVLSLLKKGQTFDSTMNLRPSTFVLNNGVLSYDKMQLDIGDMPMYFSGRLGLDDSLKAQVILPVNTRGQIVRTGEGGTGGFPLAFKGTVSDPKVDTGEILKTIAQQELLGGLLGKEKAPTTTQPGTTQPTQQDQTQQLIEQGLQGLFKKKK